MNKRNPKLAKVLNTIIIVLDYFIVIKTLTTFEITLVTFGNLGSVTCDQEVNWSMWITFKCNNLITQCVSLKY